MKGRELDTGESTYDYGNPNRDFREYRAIVKAKQFSDVRKTGGGAKEKERRRRQIAKRQASQADQVEGGGPEAPVEQ